MSNNKRPSLEEQKSSIARLRDEISKIEMLNKLENKLIADKAIIKKYPFDLKNAQSELDNLRALASNSIGFTPSSKDIEKATNHISKLSMIAGEAEAEVHLLEPQIEELKAEIETMKAKRLKDEPESIVKNDFVEVNGRRFNSIEAFQEYHNNRSY